ncbi:MAG: acetolactate synthase small subunit [Opitutales bacterium]
MKHTISILVENKFGVLARVAGMFSGRGFNIETLNVGPTIARGDSDLSRITATILGDEHALDQALRQLERLVNVLEIKHFTGRQAVSRELIMMRVHCDTDSRAEIVQICDIFRAKIIDVTADNAVIEVTGNDNKIRAFLDMMHPFGIIEMARTGNVSLERGRNGEA